MGEIKTRYKKFLLKKVRLRNEKLIRELAAKEDLIV